MLRLERNSNITQSNTILWQMKGLEQKKYSSSNFSRLSFFSRVSKPYCTSVIVCSGKCKQIGRHSICLPRVSGRALVVDTMVHLHNGILCSRKKEGAYTLCNSMDGTGEHYTKWNKPGSEGQIPYDLTFNWNLINKRKKQTKSNQRHWS